VIVVRLYGVAALEPIIARGTFEKLVALLRAAGEKKVEQALRPGVRLLRQSGFGR
jgi:hypothetical protein